RLLQLSADSLFGMGTDESHHYHGKGGSRPGRGWVMVRSRYLTPEHLILAMKRGDFYASSGVTLSDVSFDAETKTLRLAIQPEPNAKYKTEFIGTKRIPVAEAAGAGADAVPALPPAEAIGKVMASSDSLSPSYQLADDDLYIRAVVTSTSGAADPSFEDQKQQAWTQPVGWNVGKK
ncbi:MAG: hypothetical protein ACO1RT_05985, partial [Planctomycetaceae bacterium]